MTSRGWPYKVAAVGELVFLALADPTMGPQFGLFSHCCFLQHFKEEEDDASGPHFDQDAATERGPLISGQGVSKPLLRSHGCQLFAAVCSGEERRDRPEPIQLVSIQARSVEAALPRSSHSCQLFAAAAIYSRPFQPKWEPQCSPCGTQLQSHTS
ncbi:hypothetical protein NDU88_000897 [Pleurodeles waltl]|uniref:Uncharacterized protein n=1 Tax=Pleurodeles waltl TaxID=8319 RepID=A0AAV7N9H5_PLEWA|nr:hypothetical protein NDU88_000897 [Pleurodeles waltl]